MEMAVLGTVVPCLALLAGMLVLLEGGFRLGNRFEGRGAGKRAAPSTLPSLQPPCR